MAFAETPMVRGGVYCGSVDVVPVAAKTTSCYVAHRMSQEVAHVQTLISLP